MESKKKTWCELGEKGVQMMIDLCGPNKNPIPKTK
jgi:hypothetical protein